MGLHAGRGHGGSIVTSSGSVSVSGENFTLLLLLFRHNQDENMVVDGGIVEEFELVLEG